MFSLGIYDKLTPGALTGGAKIAGTGTIDERRQGRPDRRHPAEAVRRARRRRRLLPRAGRQLQRGRRARPRRAAGRQGRHLRRGAHRRRGDRRQQGRRAADRCSRGGGRGVAEAAGSVLKRRPQGVHQPGRDVARPWRPRSSLSWSRWRSRQLDSPVAQHRHQQPHVLAVRVRGQGLARPPRVARAGRARPPAGRRCARRPGRRRRPRPARRAGRAATPGTRSCGSPSCSTAVSAPRRVVGGQLGRAGAAPARAGPAVRHQGEQPRRLVPAAGGDVALGVEGGDGRGGR